MPRVEDQESLVYFDFDGTLTNLSGTRLFQLSPPGEVGGDNPDERQASLKLFQDKLLKACTPGEYNDSQISAGAVTCLKKLSKYKNVQVVIISKNYDSYIRAMLEQKGVRTDKITIMGRELLSKIPMGNPKTGAVLLYEGGLMEKGKKVEHRYFFDDVDKDLIAMTSALPMLNLGKVLVSTRRVEVGEQSQWMERFIPSIVLGRPLPDSVAPTVANTSAFFQSNPVLTQKDLLAQVTPKELLGNGPFARRYLECINETNLDALKDFLKKAGIPQITGSSNLRKVEGLGFRSPEEQGPPFMLELTLSAYDEFKKLKAAFEESEALPGMESKNPRV